MSEAGVFDARRRQLEGRYPEWRHRTLGGFLHACAVEFPDRPLVLTDDRMVT